MKRVLALLLLLLLPTPGAAAEPVRVGSKAFTESVVLGELLTALLVDAGAVAEHRRQLGGTRMLWDALVSGEIDAYVDYTGTIEREILELIGADESDVRATLAGHGVRMSKPIGFNNTYAIGMREARAAELGLETISDLAGRKDLRLGFSPEFLERTDGWPALRTRYGLPHEQVTGIDHDLAYRALMGGNIDVMEFYSTDADIQKYDLRVLRDDRGHFPEYQAVILFREDLAPAMATALLRLEDSIDAPTMIGLNARVRFDHIDEGVVAREFLADRFGIEHEGIDDSAVRRLVRNAGQHLYLVAVSMLLAIVVAIPLGVLAAKRRWLGQGILAVTGILQTIPSLALFVIFVPISFLGLSERSAIAALFLYSLLPIVRNTCTGLSDIPPSLVESARALGLSSAARFRLVELPLASRSILAGIKTATVINIGTATLGALIGTGGFGQPILTGIRRFDNDMLIWEGAVPAAALALIAQACFELLDRWLIPRGLRP